MDKEEIAKLFEDMEYFVDDDFGGHYESVVGNCEASNTFGYIKIRDYILDLQSQLDKANNKLDNIKEYVQQNSLYNFTTKEYGCLVGKGEDILSIIGGE